MKKQTINEMESWEIWFHLTATLPIAVYVSNWMYRKIRKFVKNIPEDAYEALERMLKDRKFVQVVSNAIEGEGGINDFEEKRRKNLKQKSGDHYFHDYWTAVKDGYTGKEWKNFVGEYLPNILEKIEKSDIVQDYFKKFKFTRKDKNYFLAALYYVLESDDFKHYYEKMLIDAGIKLKKRIESLPNKEKNKFLGVNDNKINLKSLLPNSIKKGV